MNPSVDNGECIARDRIYEGLRKGERTGIIGLLKSQRLDQQRRL